MSGSDPNVDAVQVRRQPPLRRFLLRLAIAAAGLAVLFLLSRDYYATTDWDVHAEFTGRGTEDYDREVVLKGKQGIEPGMRIKTHVVFRSIAGPTDLRSGQRYTVCGTVTEVDPANRIVRLTDCVRTDGR